MTCWLVSAGPYWFASAWGQLWAHKSEQFLFEQQHVKMLSSEGGERQHILWINLFCHCPSVYFTTVYLMVCKQWTTMFWINQYFCWNHEKQMPKRIHKVGNYPTVPQWYEPEEVWWERGAVVWWDEWITPENIFFDVMIQQLSALLL